MGSFILRVPNIYFFLFPSEKVNFASHKQTSYFCKKKITFVLRPDVLFVLQTSGFDYVNMFGKQSFIGTSNHKQMLHFFSFDKQTFGTFSCKDLLLLFS